MLFTHVLVHNSCSVAITSPMSTSVRKPSGSQVHHTYIHTPITQRCFAYKFVAVFSKDLVYNFDFLSSRVDFNKLHVVIGPFRKGMAPYMNKQPFDFRATFGFFLDLHVYCYSIYILGWVDFCERFSIGSLQYCLASINICVMPGCTTMPTRKSSGIFLPFNFILTACSKEKSPRTKTKMLQRQR